MGDSREAANMALKLLREQNDNDRLRRERDSAKEDQRWAVARLARQAKAIDQAITPFLPFIMKLQLAEADGEVMRIGNARLTAENFLRLLKLWEGGK
jgi:hypothetical protein